ncbi:DUF397 domain-containing protein [Streptomyces hygroscopicus]|uniref:DUF397 domain-containing protein n=1 Tax=Streptomyces hygroscopicus TaxID=1912 RepID=UPI003681B0D8
MTPSGPGSTQRRIRRPGGLPADRQPLGAGTPSRPGRRGVAAADLRRPHVGDPGRRCERCQCLGRGILPTGHQAGRNTKDRERGALLFEPSAWQAFVDAVRGGAFRQLAVRHA